jgi:hypothetical protein
VRVHGRREDARHARRRLRRRACHVRRHNHVAPRSLWERDETCPVSTERWTRRRAPAHQLRRASARRGARPQARGAPRARATTPGVKPGRVGRRIRIGRSCTRSARRASMPLASPLASLRPDVSPLPSSGSRQNTSTACGKGTRRVQLVRRDGRDVSTLYGREGGGGGTAPRSPPAPGGRAAAARSAVRSTTPPLPRGRSAPGRRRGGSVASIRVKLKPRTLSRYVCFSRDWM